MNANKSPERDTGKPRLPQRKVFILFILIILTLASSFFESFFGAFTLGIVFTVLTPALAASALIFSCSLLPILAAVPAYIISFAFSHDPISALGSLGFVPVALVLYFSYKKKHTRVGMICRVSAVLAAFKLLMLAIAFFSHGGNPSADQIRALAESIRTDVSDTLFESLSYVLQGSIDISYEAVSKVVAYMLTLLPGIFITICNTAAYFIQLTVVFIGKAVGAKDMIYGDMRTFKISRMAALIYIASYLLFVFFSGEGISLTGAVLENLIIIFTPGLALYGIKDFAKRIKERTSAFPVFLVLGMLILFFTVPALFFGLTAFSGAWAAFRNKR